MNRDKFRFIKTHKIMTFVVAAILTLTIGYAIFSESIDILGLASTGSSNFNIVFDRVGQIEEHEATGTSANIVDAGKKLEIRVEHLKMPSSYVEIPVVVKNKGDITAKVKEIKTSGLDTTDIKVTYEGLLLEDVLNPNDERSLKITVTWDMSSVNPNVVADFTIEIVYEQVVGETTTSAPTEIVDNRFIYEGTKLMGLSAEGEEYFKTNKELIIPEGTTEIADGAFLVPYGYTGTIPNFETYESATDELIEYNRKNSRLSGATISFPNSLRKIGNSAFTGLSLTGDLTIPNNVEEIGVYAFYLNNFNGNLKLPEKLEIIKDYYFAANQFTGDLLMPRSIEEIGISAFQMAGFNGRLILSEGLKKVGHYAFYTCNFIGDLVIPDSVTEIGGVAFGSGYTGSLTISKNLTEIPKMAFIGTGFTGELYIPDNIANIDYGAFWECNNITSISISSGTTYKEVASGGDRPSFPTGIPINVR